MDLGFISDFLSNFVTYVVSLWLGFIVPIIEWYNELPVWVHIVIIILIFMIAFYMLVWIRINSDELSYY